MGVTKKRKQPVGAATDPRAGRAKRATSRPPRPVTETPARQSKSRNFESEARELFRDKDRLDELLLLEKTNRGVDQKQLVFAGFSDVSAQVFCSMKAVLRARESEKMYFRAYLKGRLYYANELRALERWPRSNIGLLQVIQSITFEQVEALEKPHYGDHPLPGETSEILPLEIKIKGPNVDYATRGDVLEFFCAERYHKFMWHFPYGRYVFLAIPDGITNDFVYEFKSGSNARFRPERTTEAVVQGDLYGYFFRKRMKRVQVYTSDDRRRESRNSLVDEENAVKYLKNFARVDGGEMPKLPSPGKCRSCDFVASCPLYSAAHRQPTFSGMS
jgi:CRISPR/Cas system-associated exonuclease Cas4 (RecB family)